MKKAIGLAVLTMSLMAGTVTAYAANTGAAVTGPGCTQGAYCEQYECMRDGECTYTDCPYHGTGVYENCEIDHVHNRDCYGATNSTTTRGHHRGRGHHGRGHC